MTDSRRERTKEALKAALIKLLKKKNFDQITATELVSQAGISRSGFYNYYTDKFDMVDQYQQLLFNMISYIFDKHQGDLRATLLETFQLMAKNDIYAALLSENGSKEIHSFFRAKIKDLLEKQIFQQLGDPRQLGELRDRYASAYYAHAIFGLTQAWLLQGHKKESPELIADLLVKLIDA